MKLLTLENGLRIIMQKRDDLRSATVGVWVASGSNYEDKSINGISHFIEHIVFKGSLKRSAAEIAEGMDEIGAHVNAYTTKEYTFFYTKALDYQIAKAADILFDMIKNPRLDEKDIETEKGVIIEEIAMYEDDPSDVCYEANEAAIFSGSPLAFSILGTRESVSGITRQDFVSYMNKIYVPERTVVGISGNYNESEILELVKQYFGKDENTPNYIKPYDVLFKKSFTLKKQSFEQTHIMLTFDGVPIEHEDLYALQVCMFILGNGTSSKLNQRIREQLGLVYEIGSWLGRYLSTGYIAVSMSLSPASEEKALREMLEIVRTLPQSISEKELSRAKEKLIASLIMSREQPQSKLSSFGYSQLMLSKFIEDDFIIDSIKDIRLEEVSAVAKKYLKIENASFTAVGKVKSKKFYQDIINEYITK